MIDSGSEWMLVAWTVLRPALTNREERRAEGVLLAQCSSWPFVFSALTSLTGWEAWIRPERDMGLKRTPRIVSLWRVPRTQNFEVSERKAYVKGKTNRVDTRFNWQASYNANGNWRFSLSVIRQCTSDNNLTALHVSGQSVRHYWSIRFANMPECLCGRQVLVFFIILDDEGEERWAITCR